MKKRTSISVVMGLLVSLLTVTSFAKPPQIEFKVGDRVERDWAGTTLTGTVETVDQKSGWITIKYDDKTQYADSVPARIVRRLDPKREKQSKDKSKTSTSSGSSSKKRAADNELRTWTDHGGKHQIEATLLHFKDGKATLKRKDGKEVTLDLEKFSEADQEYLTGHAISESNIEDEVQEAEIIKTDRARLRLVDATGPTQWSYVPDPADEEPTLKGRPLPLGKLHLAERPKDFFLAPDTLKAMVVLTEHYESRVMNCDLKKSKVEWHGPFVPHQRPLAVSANMEQVLACSTQHSIHEGEILYLYDVKDSKPKLRCAWRPYADTLLKRKLLWAHVIDKDHVLTLGELEHLVCWDVSESVEPVYQVGMPFMAIPRLSPHGKNMAVPVENGVALLEPLTGQVVGHLPTIGTFKTHLAFDAEGRQLAMHLYNR